MEYNPIDAVHTSYLKNNNRSSTITTNSVSDYAALYDTTTN